MAKKTVTKAKSIKSGTAKPAAVAKPAAPTAKAASKYTQTGAPWWKQHLPSS